MFVDRVVRSRLARIALAGGLIGLGTWEFLPYLTHRVASSAFVNAEIVRVTAPIRGRLSTDVPEKGAYLEEDAKLTLVEALVPDRRQLAVFEQQFAVANAQIELAEKHLEEVEEADLRLLDRADRHRAAILSELEAEIQEAQAETDGCRIEHQDLERDLRLRQQLQERGVASTRASETAESAFGAAGARCDAAEARLERLSVEKKAAEAGVFLRDGNDTPYSQQQRDRLMLRRQEVEAQLLSEKARVKQLESEIGEERGRILDTTRFDFTLPKEHLVWEVSASPGSSVVEGQSLIDLADCTRRFVSVLMPERQVETIRRGDVAQIRLLGSDTWTTGIVERMRGSAAQTDGRLYAAQPTVPSERHITVDVLIDPSVLDEDSSRQCDIGRQAEVRFDRGLSKLLASIGSAFAPESRAEPVK